MFTLLGTGIIVIIGVLVIVIGTTIGITLIVKTIREERRYKLLKEIYPLENMRI